MVNRGDGLFHVARVAALADAEETLEELELELENDPLFDDSADRLKLPSLEEFDNVKPS